MYAEKLTSKVSTASNSSWQSQLQREKIEIKLLVLEKSVRSSKSEKICHVNDSISIVTNHGLGS